MKKTEKGNKRSKKSPKIPTLKQSNLFEFFLFVFMNFLKAVSQRIVYHKKVRFVKYGANNFFLLFAFSRRNC